MYTLTNAQSHEIAMEEPYGSKYDPIFTPKMCRSIIMDEDEVMVPSINRLDGSKDDSDWVIEIWLPRVFALDRSDEDVTPPVDRCIQPR